MKGEGEGREFPGWKVQGDDEILKTVLNERGIDADVGGNGS